ncbi:MAG: TIGR02147 family protein [Pseudobdellovibrionaceae bacterium]
MLLEIEKVQLRPEILKYQDYRKILLDFYEYKKSLRSGFSYRKFSELAGVSSPNYLQLVIQGKRNISNGTAEKVCEALKLLKSEKSYFLGLVSVENALTQEEKVQAKKDLLVAIGKLITKEIPKSQVEVLSQWYHLLVRELVVLKNFKPDGEWISELLRGIITPNQAEESLKLLLQAGFLTVKNKEYVQSEPVVDTGNAFDEFKIIKSHTEILKVWAKNLNEFAREDRQLGVMNIPIHHSKIPEFKNKILKFQQEIVGWLQDEKDVDGVVMFGTYLIPMTKKAK